jgi:mono/diheme cytochrome c family protein
MDSSRISEQERRENADPQEASNAIPKGIYILVGCLVVFGAYYILIQPEPLAPAMGDQRTLADLQPKPATNAGAATGGADGAALYAARCAACHQATGAGLPSVFPPLAGSEWATGKGEALASILLHGVTGAITVKGATFNGAMPAFKDQLKDEELAAISTYLRSQWGNKAPPVTAEVVAKARAETASRATPYNGDAELAALK